MPAPFHSRRRAGLAASLGLALVAAPFAALPAHAAPGDTTKVTLLNINDFHGRIDANTVKFAGTIEQLRAAAGEENTALLSDGDNIGASLFASSSQQDEPTIDVLNALELRASAVGNHEFDQGYNDLDGRVADSADWSYLGANVYFAGTTEPALQTFEVLDIAGVRVAVIGAVTEETPTLVAPGGISTLDFGNPVEAVNRVAAEIEATDAADVIVAEYHEGAGANAADGATLEQELALDTAFTDIVTNTSAAVDVIFTGHTHKEYVYDAPVPGVAGATRPVLQTGSYGANIGQIELTVDDTTGDVVSYVAGNVPQLADAEGAEEGALDAELIATYPRVAEVAAITQSAIDAADVIGGEVIGSVTADITTAFVGDVRDDRASESVLGGLVADSLVASLSDEQLGGAEIGIVNPGGLRAELFYAPTTDENPGEVTYAEANAVLPFVNNLYTTSLTGAQFKEALEQQWQLDADGNVPSRPFLALGLSKNVSFTYDETRAQGDHITSITIDGAPIDPAASYRVGSFSFLLEGGDNFRVLAEGTDTRDSGLIDRDAWIDYISTNSPLTPTYDRRGVSVTGVPASVERGASSAVTLGKLDLTSLGVPANTEVSAVFEDSTAAPVVSPVTAGTATVAFTVPVDAPDSAVLVVTAKESGTVVRVPINVTAAVVTPPVVTPPVIAPVVPAPELAATGVDATVPLGAGALLLLAGAALLLVRRRHAARG
jgi:5'-nucleotidase